MVIKIKLIGGKGHGHTINVPDDFIGPTVIFRKLSAHMRMPYAPTMKVDPEYCKDFLYFVYPFVENDFRVWIAFPEENKNNKMETIWKYIQEMQPL